MVVEAGGLVAGFDPGTTSPYINYATPMPGAAPTRRDVAALIAAFRTRGLRPRLEFAPDAAPDVESVLRAAGFTVEEVHEYLVCTPATLTVPAFAAAPLVETPVSDQDYAAIDAALSEAFTGEFLSSPHGASRLRRAQENGGAVRFVRSPDRGCAGGASCSAPAVGRMSARQGGPQAALPRPGGIGAACPTRVARRLGETPTAHVIDLVREPAERRGFAVHRKRWVVERTLAWLTAHRRPVRDYERDPEVSGEMIRWAAINHICAASPAANPPNDSNPKPSDKSESNPSRRPDPRAPLDDPLGTSTDPFRRTIRPTPPLKTHLAALSCRFRRSPCPPGVGRRLRRSSALPLPSLSPQLRVAEGDAGNAGLYVSYVDCLDSDYQAIVAAGGVTYSHYAR